MMDSPLDRLPADTDGPPAVDATPVIDAPPPILGTWKRLYLTVLVVHLLFLVGFYLFTRYYA